MNLFTKIKELFQMKRHHLNLNSNKPVIKFTASLIAASIGCGVISSYATARVPGDEDFNNDEIIAIEENTLETPDAEEVETRATTVTTGTTSTAIRTTIKATTATITEAIVTATPVTTTANTPAPQKAPPAITEIITTTTTTAETTAEKPTEPATTSEETKTDDEATTTTAEATTTKSETTTTVTETTPAVTTTKKTEWVVYKPSTHYIHKNTCHWYNDECYEIESTDGLECRRCTECCPDMDIITEYAPTPVSNGYTSLNYVTEEERVYLCNTVAYEYGSDWVPLYDKACVVATVMNRVRDGGWTNGLPSTVYNVLTAPYQYNPVYASPYYCSKVTQSCIDAVEYYFAHQEDFPHYTSFWGDGRYNYFR